MSPKCFGLHGVAAIFQRLVDKLLQPVAAFAVAYIDDIILFSQTWEEGLAHNRAVLIQQSEFGLTVYLNKCHIGRQQANYLGYVVGKEQLRAQLDKVQTLQ